MNLLKGKVVAVTGGTKGIGYAASCRMAEEGAVVYACARNEVRFENENIHYLHLDVTDLEECSKAAKIIADEQGRIDGLVADAGITRDALVCNMTEDMFDDVYKVNVRGVFNIIKAVQVHMEQKRYGSIIAISSVVGEYGNIGQANYAASKAAIIGLIKSCAKEFARKGQNIRVNAVCPGYIMTDMLKNVPDHLLEKVADQTMLKRLGRPEEVADTLAFLISDRASYITGSVIDINGGMRL